MQDVLYNIVLSKVLPARRSLLLKRLRETQKFHIKLLKQNNEQIGTLSAMKGTVYTTRESGGPQYSLLYMGVNSLLSLH